MNTIGACGYIGTGSSAVIDLLREFDETQIMNFTEFVLSYITDGLEDLDYHINSYRKYMSSVVAVFRFKKMIKCQMKLNKATNNKLKKISDEFIDNLNCICWHGEGLAGEYYYRYLPSIPRKVMKKAVHLLKCKRLINLYSRLLFPKFEMTVFPDNFDDIAKNYIFRVLNSMGRDVKKITVLEQPFEGCNPVKSFKYFDNPKAIVVDRDPRDHYLNCKCFYRPRGIGYQVPCDNANDYIKYYRLIHKSPNFIRERNDILFINFESMVYDYENTILKITDFCNISNHNYKGVYFKPQRSVNNTQLFKKFTEFQKDIELISYELNEYLFPFDNYAPVRGIGGMFDVER